MASAVLSHMIGMFAVAVKEKLRSKSVTRDGWESFRNVEGDGDGVVDLWQSG